MTKEEYNSVPVYYCKHCHSLRIKTIPFMENVDFCDSCGSTDIAQISIEEWEELYKDEHDGVSFLDN